MGTQAQVLHYEIEKGFYLNRHLTRALKRKAKKLGLTFSRKVKITDFVIPSTGRSTKRLRVERTVSSANGHLGIELLRCSKSHPIKGERGEHVRYEQEPEITLDAALKFIARAIDKHEAGIPRYWKTRTEYTCQYEGFDWTIALDHAFGLGHYSGRYMEIETILPADSPRVVEALAAIDSLAIKLIGKQKVKISYRKMLMATWDHTKVSSKKQLENLRSKYRKLIRGAAKAA
jgi:hypothetical protein